MDDSVLGELWVARDGQEIVGALEIVPIGEVQVVLHVAVVRADRRGEGIGTQLMRVAFSSYEAEWWTETRSERIAFYERLGFGVVPLEDMPAKAESLLNHPSTTNPERPLNFLRRPPTAV